MTPPSQRLVFANQLRGLAALGVISSHLIGVFWAMPEFVGAATASPVQPGNVPTIFALVANPWLNPGPIGVGVFFLISGLVIPFSLDRHTRARFLLARVARIFPTYLAAIVIDVIVLDLAGAFWQRPFPYNGSTIFSNALLFYNLVGRPSIDLVNWTLCIEILFYGLMTILARRVKLGRLFPLFFAATVMLLAICARRWVPLGGFGLRNAALLDTLSLESTFLIFMLIGVLFNYHHRGFLSAIKAGTVIGLMLAMFVVAWRIGALRPQYPVVTANYLLAFIVFTVAYGLRTYARPFAPLDFLAAISFPLYLVHSIVGFVCLKVFMLVFELAYVPSLIATAMIVIALAFTLHRAIERPTIRIGQRLALSRQRNYETA